MKTDTEKAQAPDYTKSAAYSQPLSRKALAIRKRQLLREAKTKAQTLDEAQHSPLPWFVTRGNEIGHDGKDVNGNRHVGYVAETLRRNQYGRADADFIVKACNNYERIKQELRQAEQERNALKKACEEGFKMLKRYMSEAPTDWRADKALKLMTAALALVEKGGK